MTQHLRITAQSVEPPKSLDAPPTFTPDLILDPADPLPSAREYRAREHSTTDGLPTLHYHKGDFYSWAGCVHRVTDDAAIRAGAYAFLERAQRMQKIDDVEQLVPFKPTKTKVDFLIDALRGVTHLETQSIPTWIGEPGPDPAECIPVNNGILHIPTRRLYPPSARFFNVNAVNFDYDPDAPTPDNWLRFLLSVWPDDEQARDTLQEIFGLLLTLDTRYEKIFLIVGPKRSGKGTIGRVLRALLGVENVCGPTLSGLASHFGMESLIGKQAAIISDARLGNRTDQAIIAERLLAISGEDGLSVPRKNRGDWLGRLLTRFLLFTNELPRITDASGALASRFVVLTMNKSFYGAEDHGLTDRLLGELPGIFNWALEGLRRLRERGRFITPDSSASAVAELEELGSPVGAFVRERCIVEPGRTIACRAMFEAWKGWCADNGRDHTGNIASFGRDLRAAAPGVCTGNPLRSGGSRVRFYEGVDLA